MKNFTKLIFVCLFLAIMVSCNKQPLPNYYEKIRWVAQEVDFYFDVDSKFYDECASNTKGILVTKEKSETVTIRISYSGRFYVLKMPTSKVVKNEVSGRDETVYEEGDCVLEGRISEFNEIELKQFTLRIEEEYQYIFGDEPIKEITFVREEMPTDEQSESGESLDISKSE